METGTAVELGMFAVLTRGCSCAVHMMTASSERLEMCSVQE